VNRQEGAGGEKKEKMLKKKPNGSIVSVFNRRYPSIDVCISAFGIHFV
jgi:hypothetical protein